MSQQLEDLKLLLKNDRKIWAAGGFIAIALVVWLATDSGSKRRRARVAPAIEASESGSSQQEQYHDLITAYGNAIEAAEDERKDTQETLRRTSEDFKEHKQRLAGIVETLVDKFEQLARDVDTLSNSMRIQNERPQLVRGPNIEGEGGIEPFGDTEDPGDVAPERPELPPRVSVIAPGDSVPLKLLTGVNAPTDGTPYPVVFEVNGPIAGPDGASLDVGSARLIAAAQGSEADGRALFRLTQLSIRHPSGRRSVVDIDGWIVGEDGVRGMQGELIDKLGRLIFTTAAVSGVAALGNRVSGRNNVLVNNNGGLTQLGSDDVDTAAASALTDASNRLGQVLLNRYEALVPVVEILSGRQVSAIFSKPAELELINDKQLLLAGGTN